MNRLRLFLGLATSMLVAASAAIAQASASGSNKAPPGILQVMEDGMRAELLFLAFGISDSAKRAEFAGKLNSSRALIVPTLDTTRWKAPGLKVWVGFPSQIDHWHHYTVGELNGRVFKLGGFSAPQALELDQALGASPEAQLDRALVLAALLDENGATHLRVVDSAKVPLSDGEVVVFVTTEATQLNSFRPRLGKWQYSFLFDRNGYLKNWARLDRSPKA